MSLKETQVFAVKNVVNNNIVIVHDFNGREMVAIGKGLGFKKKKNDLVYPDEVMKTYVLVNKSKTNLLTLFEEVPFEIIEVSQQIIDYASEILNAKFNVNLLTGLADISGRAKRRILSASVPLHMSML